MIKQFILPFALGAIIAGALVGGTIYAGTRLTQNQTYFCPLSTGAPTSYHGTGFLASRPAGWGMQFVIRPGTTAFLQVTYRMIGYNINSNATYVAANSAAYLSPIKYWLPVGTVNTFLNTSQVGMTAIPINATASGTYVLNTIYEISTASNATQGAYNAGWFDTCGPQIIMTIGYSLYTGPGLSGGTYY